MKLKINRNIQDNNEIRYTLAGEMNVYTAVKLKELLLKELQSSAGLKMNLAGVNEADTSAFQLLIFLKREAVIIGKSFQITEVSGRLKSIFTLYKEPV